MPGEKVAGTESAAGFLEHAVECGVGTMEGAQAWWQHVGVADSLGVRFDIGQVDATEEVPHTVALNGAPDFVEFPLAGAAEGLHVEDAGGAEAALHAAADAGDVVELEAVEFVGEFVEIESGQAVGLFQLTGELGEELVGCEADGDRDVWADRLGQCGFDLAGFALGHLRWLPVWWQAAIHFVDTGDLIDVDDLVDDIVDGLGGFDVVAVIAFDKLDAGAEIAGLAHPRAGLNTVGFGLVAGGDAASSVNA